MKRFIQIVAGLALLLASVVIILVAANSNPNEDNGIGALFFTIPFGLYLVFTRKIVLY